MQVKTKFVEELNMMKVLATFLVVLGHVFTNYRDGGLVKPYYGNDFFVSLCSYIYSFHMPAFVAVSGGVYFYTRRVLMKYNNWLSYVLNKLKRIIVPYIFFSVFVVFPTLFVLGFTGDNPLKYFLVNYVLALDPRHLWFLLMLFEVFLLFRFFDKYVDKHNCIVGLCLALTLNWYSRYIPTFFQLGTMFRYLIYFYLGYAFMQNKNKLDGFLGMRYVGLFCFMISVVTWDILKYDLPSMVHWIIEVFCAVAGSITLYICSKQLSNSKIVQSDIYQRISNNAFGIYLFHPVLIYSLLYITQKLSINPWVLATSTFILSFILSSYLTTFFRTIKLGWAIGERKR